MTRSCSTDARPAEEQATTAVLRRTLPTLVQLAGMLVAMHLLLG